MRKFTNIIIILFLSCSSYAQVYQAYINAAEKAYASNDFRSALAYYGEAIDLDSEVDVEILQKYAKSANEYKSFNTAKTAYTQILEQEDESIKADAIFHLAEISKSLGQYAEAQEYITQYLSLNIDNEERNAIVNKSLKDILWALDNTIDSVYQIEKLDQQVNTEFSEMSPVEYDGVLYYASNNYFVSSEDLKPQSKIYENEEGKSSRMISDFNESDAQVGHYALNTSKTAAYFTKCKFAAGEAKCKIYKKTKSGEIFELPQNINAVGAHTTQPNIGIDPQTGNEILFFASDRQNGKGGMDIYYAPIDNGAFNGPFALDHVNTAADEISPFYHNNSNTLYFSTNGRETFGGLDVYSTTLGDSWSALSNLGSGINSSYDDAYFSLNEDNVVGYFSSNRLGSNYIDEELEACCYDIYKATVELKSITLKVYDKETKTALNGAKVNILELPSENKNVLLDPSSSEYQLDLKTKLAYDLSIEKLGYKVEKINLGPDADAEIEVYLSLAPLNLLATVLDENGENLSDYKYTLSKTDEKEGAAKTVKKKEDISEVIARNSDYILKVEKDGYYPETVTIAKKDLTDSEKIDLKINLKKLTKAALIKLTLDAYLPLPIYFDNDEPDQNTTATTTTKNYHQTFEKYIKREGEYVAKNTADLNTEQKMDTESKVRQFFNNKVRGGDTSLDGFTQHLLNFLQQGSQAEIMLRGYASPRSQSAYNDALTSRRVRSVENHFYQWNGGILVPYINSGQLKLTERPLGESLAPAGISDELSDQKGSIYSVEASNERRVEILEIKSSNVNPN